MYYTAQYDAAAAATAAAAADDDDEKFIYTAQDYSKRIHTYTYTDTRTHDVY